jgi:hypothetical protein
VQTVLWQQGLPLAPRSLIAKQIERMPLWVNRAGLPLCQPLPIYPDERTSSDPPTGPFRASNRHWHGYSIARRPGGVPFFQNRWALRVHAPMTRWTGWRSSAGRIVARLLARRLRLNEPI